MNADRIDVAFYTDSSTFGGAEQVLANLLGSLGDGFQATVVGVSPAIVEAVSCRRPQTRAIVLPPVTAPWDVRAIAAHFACMRRLRPDVLHAQGASPWACEYALVAALVTHGVEAVSVVQSPSPASRLRERVLLKLATPRLAARVAPGDRSARELERVAGLRAGSVVAIHNGVEDRPVVPAPRPTGGPLIGWIGRLAPEKGIDVLLAALAELPGVTALLVGDGPERESLGARADQLGVADRVIFTGWQANPRPFLHALDVFVLPSRIEAFPLAALEAMLAERPVVASDVGSVREAVIGGETGLLVPPDEPRALAAAIRSLIADDETRRRLGRRGRSVVLERYTAAAMTRRYEGLYRRIVDGSRR